MRRVSSAAMTATSRSTRSARSGDVFEVADRRGDHEQRAGHWKGAIYCTIGGSVPLDRSPGRPDTLESHDCFRTASSLRRRSARVPARDASDARDARRRAHARRSARGLQPARRSRPRSTRSRAICRRLGEIDRDGLTAGRAARAPHARRRTSRRGCSSSRTSAPGSGTRSSTRTSSRRAWPARRSSRTRRPTERARRVLSKLRQTPRLIQAARDNIKDPPGIFVKVGIETMRGRADVHRRRSAARVRRRGRPAPARRSRRRADRGRRRPSAPTSQYLETDVAPRARARSGWAASKFEQKLKLDEGHRAAASIACSRSRRASCRRRRRSSARSPAA